MALLLALSTASLGTSGAGAQTASETGDLVGIFGIAPGACEGSEVAGSYFRMIQKDGTETGPFVANSDSPCLNDSYTPLLPGSMGGLSTASFQSNPSEPFDALGNGRVRKIVQPQTFFGVSFAVSTNRVDPQSGTQVSKPRVSHDGNGGLTGDLRAVSVAWNGQHFNQGSPAPNGNLRGLTTPVEGTYSSGSRSFTLDWTSTIYGGPFDGFTGVWHLEGTFKPAVVVSFSVDDPAPTASDAISMSGRTAPSSTPESVRIKTQRYRSGSWTAFDSATTNTDPMGDFVYEHEPIRAGRYRARALVAETGDHLAGKSSWVAFKVAPALESHFAPQRVETSASWATPDRTSGASAAEPLYGLFRVTPGDCSGNGGSATTSYFQMTQAGADPDSGPYVENGDSPCGDKRSTPVRPGVEGGLSTSQYQPNPEPAFDGGGNGLANKIVQPQKWFGVTFAASTNPTDPQSDIDVPVPQIVHDGNGGLSGDVRAYSTAWNNEHFNQGSPKPDGSRPGQTQAVTGTFDAATGAFMLEWTSTIVGGPFNNFTGTWHLEGTFEPGPAPVIGGASGGSGSPEDPSGSGAVGAVTTTAEGTSQTAGEELPNTGQALPEWLGMVLLGTCILGLSSERLLRNIRLRPRSR